jgi:hypothetical protein
LKKQKSTDGLAPMQFEMDYRPLLSNIINKKRSLRKFIFTEFKSRCDALANNEDMTEIQKEDEKEKLKVSLNF